MAVGTSGGLLTEADDRAQSVFKHALLHRYMSPFIAMPGSTSEGNRVVVLDGFAGRGRYPDGTPGSAELILRAIRGLKTSRNVSAYFAEKDKKLYPVLKGVVEEFKAQGLQVEPLPGAVNDHLDMVIDHAQGVPLFLFLDPCGAGLPFKQLAGVLAGARRGLRPQTEVLLNFSSDLSRRAAGVLNRGRLTDPIISTMDITCGGEWWRETAQATLRGGRANDFEPVVHAIASEYARRLALKASMTYVAIPVRRRLHHQPIYHLIFLTRSPYGMWVFADAAGRARKEYLERLGKLEDEDAPGQQALIGDADDNDMEWLIKEERDEALKIVISNLRGLIEQHPRIKLVNYAAELFGEAYGFATEPTVTEAVKQLKASRKLVVLENASRLRDRTVGPA